MKNNPISLKLDTKCIVFKISLRENKNAFDDTVFLENYTLFGMFTQNSLTSI